MREVIFALCSALERPHLEYYGQFCTSQPKRDLDIQDKVQFRATGMMEGPENLSFEERVSELGLLGLEKRRLRGISPMPTNP